MLLLVLNYLTCQFIHLCIQPGAFLRLSKPSALHMELPGCFILYLRFAAVTQAFRPEIAINKLDLALAIKRS